jgi:ketosteroid isomerase-like protein
MYPFNSKFILGIIFTLISLVTSAQKQKAKPGEMKEIWKIMTMQEQAWNEGNLNKFMEGYWNSDSLSFVGKSGITYGWKQTLANYKKNYPDKATMGHLTFTLIKNESLGAQSHLVIGKWHLKREKDEVGGYFTLIWKKINGKWLIISDHTS